jgi:hypothetical protein
MFSATAGSASRPAGLLNGLSTLGATAGGGTTALNGDIAKLITSIASVGNPDDIAIIASPSQAAALMLQPRSGQLRVWSSRALAAGTVLAVDVNGFISAFLRRLGLKRAVMRSRISRTARRLQSAP